MRSLLARLGEDPLSRTVNGLRSAWARVPEPAVEVVRRRARIVADTPSLRAAVARNNLRTEDALVGQLVADGCDRAAGARGSIGGAGRVDVCTAVVGRGGDGGPVEALERALSVFDPVSDAGVAVSDQVGSSGGRGPGARDCAGRSGTWRRSTGSTWTCRGRSGAGTGRV